MALNTVYYLVVDPILRYQKQYMHNLARDQCSKLEVSNLVCSSFEKLVPYYDPCARKQKLYAYSHITR